MGKRSIGLDQLFLKAEKAAGDRSLFPEYRESTDRRLEGVLSSSEISSKVQSLRRLTVDGYIAQTVQPAEEKTRPGAKAILKRLGSTIWEQDFDALYAAEMDVNFGDRQRRLGVLAQERTSNNGVWMPEHHLAAVDFIRRCAEYSMPLVCLIDTPGADAGEIANRNNQAHAISRLITEMGLLDLPTVGVIIGNGYSGGAIPLATTNILLSVRDGVFNTIQPQGLASIARKYDLSWQECAKYVGVSAYELCRQGYVDAVIDYVPGERNKFDHFRQAIVSSIRSIEDAATAFVTGNPDVFDHYRRSIFRYIEPSDSLEQLQRQSELSLPPSPTSHLNIFGISCRYLRYLCLRRRICSTTVDSYGRLSSVQIPKGDLQERTRREREHAFQQWLQNAVEMRYEEALSKAWKNYLDKQAALQVDRGRLMTWLQGDPKQRFYQARKELLLVVAFYLYNLWKTSAHQSFLLLIEHLRSCPKTRNSRPEVTTVLEVMEQEGLRESFIKECQNILLFDLIYNAIINNQIAIAREAKDYNVISKTSVNQLLGASLERAVAELAANQPDDTTERNDAENALKDQFAVWLGNFTRHNRRGDILKAVQEWKQLEFPRMSEPLFAIITFFFEHLLPAYYAAEKSGTYDGQITLRDIGIKDFWNRLAIAYQDILIQDILLTVKKERKANAQAIIETFFTDFRPLDENLMTADPVQFPGFRLSIEQALERGVTPCGLLTGIGRFRSKSMRRRVGVAVSNIDFQAGAFDMASGEKFCRLLVECATHRLPVVCFISSGGMQTKEGAGALFSMAIVNDRITRFVRDNDLPIICFGFGDCTGGAQASLVTHPLVQTYYFSGTNMPFAGQIVVPSYLPTTATLSNYLSTVNGAMQGLVTHPFADDLDAALLAVDRDIPIAREGVIDVVTRIIKEGVLDDTNDDTNDNDESAVVDAELSGPLNSVLIHARGCTAVKLIDVAQRKGINVVLVQSDADMDSVAAEMLGTNDQLVCLGGNTPDESYLNASSVVRIAERENVDALHPGIGFLSENPHFSALCRRHGLRFVGPTAHSMELMGNKSNAINTALRLKVPVVPGSHGIITNSAAAAAVADEIGYPVILKAVHGGGGKGIQIVESPDNFHELFAKISAEARSAFGNSDVYIEKCVVSLRHVEVQILRDTAGTTKVLGLRDCSVQRQNQKIIEESSSTGLPDELEQTMYRSASALADAINYTGAGTVEFIYDLKEQAVYFMEMNTRLQVEHPVTEQVTGVDIVGTQFDIAAGGRIDDIDVQSNGYAIEVRINAEKATIDNDGKMQFIPHPGTISEMSMPTGDDIITIATAGKGKTIPPYYDSMIVQFICTGTDRDDTIDKLIRYLDEIVIRGVCTNIPLVKRILADEIFRSGVYDTRFLDGFLTRIDTEELIDEIEAAAGVVQLDLDVEALRIEGGDELKVIAPSTGIFYLTPSPSEPDFVGVGDVVKLDQTLCLLEAMKVFRTLTLDSFNSEDSTIYSSNADYEIVRINPTSGQAVNTGDLLFVVKPA